MNATATAAAVQDPDSFAAMFEESLTRKEMRAGELITAQVVRIDHNMVVVNAGLKSESLIAIEEFLDAKGEIEVKAGDFVTVAIESLENGYGETKLSREKAKRLAAWHDLELAMEEGRVVEGFVSGKVKGGLTAMVNGIRAFLPGSLVDIRPVKDTTPYENKTMELKVIKLDRKRNNVVVSRRAVLEASMGADREAVMENLKEGAIVKGVVKNITDYGAFVDLGGIDGLLHITDLAWRRVKHPSEVLTVGDEVEAKILKFDQEKNRVSLGIKQMGDDPWNGLARRYPQGTRMFGKVTNLTDYGAFVEIEQGIEGLVHVSDTGSINPDSIPNIGLGGCVECDDRKADYDTIAFSAGYQLTPDLYARMIYELQQVELIDGTIDVAPVGLGFEGAPGSYAEYLTGEHTKNRLGLEFTYFLSGVNFGGSIDYFWGEYDPEFYTDLGGERVKLLPAPGIDSFATALGNISTRNYDLGQYRMKIWMKVGF